MDPSRPCRITKPLSLSAHGNRGRARPARSWSRSGCGARFRPLEDEQQRRLCCCGSLQPRRRRQQTTVFLFPDGRLNSLHSLQLSLAHGWNFLHPESMQCVFTWLFVFSHSQVFWSCEVAWKEQLPFGGIRLRLPALHQISEQQETWNRNFDFSMVMIVPYG